ncbi:Crp/Fnr family transcriptional regulator [Sphingobium boeckii]|uniref:CRP/FNR family transcriptional regulator n=1 Tax=Sphingobium boeckii TaxID=1082345 RepID=A0A7W9AJ68_9SPHN|nr:Crp/Fnr family transcriptional regulator [Sphingobium boeckii]MBB5686677.1 CRP/FNR family transcriptional regulator [Sphingobium boeckii]
MTALIQALAASQPQAQTECEACALSAGTICARLGAEGRGELHRMGRRRAIAKGQTILWQGETASAVANVLSGTVKLSATTADGREQILGIVGAGGFIGRIDDKASAFSAIALNPVEICLFPRSAFVAMAEHHPEVGAALLERALADLDRARRWLLMIGRGTAIERVAALLVDFAGESTSTRHAFPLSRGQMADLAGLTIETVSRQLGKIKSAGLIAMPSRDIFEIRDMETLRAIAGEQPGNRPH